MGAPHNFQRSLLRPSHRHHLVPGASEAVTRQPAQGNLYVLKDQPLAGLHGPGFDNRLRSSSRRSAAQKFH